MPIVAIAREFGAGGETIGQGIAERLGIDYLDGKIVDEVAHRLGMKAAVIDGYDEKAGGLLDRLLREIGTAGFSTPFDGAAWTPPHDDLAWDPRKSVLAVTQKIILNQASTGNGIIVGRGAAYLLAHHPAAIRVFIRAAVDSRVAAVMMSRAIDEAMARVLVKREDANSHAYIKQVYLREWQHAAHFDLVIDSARLGSARAIEVVLAALPEKDLRSAQVGEEATSWWVSARTNSRSIHASGVRLS